MTLKIMNSVKYAGPRCEPKNRDLRPICLGWLRSRIAQKTTRPRVHITAMKSWRKPRNAQLPKTNQLHSGSRLSSAAYAST
jgi:hypothetical protein